MAKNGGSGQRNGRQGGDGGGKGKVLGLQVEVMVESRALAAEENGELDGKKGVSISFDPILIFDPY